RTMPTRITTLPTHWRMGAATQRPSATGKLICAWNHQACGPNTPAEDWLNRWGNRERQLPERFIRLAVNAAVKSLATTPVISAAPPALPETPYGKPRLGRQAPDGRLQSPPACAG